MAATTSKFRTHVFDSTEEAYDATQTGYYRFKEIPNEEFGVEVLKAAVYTEVYDGDLLCVPTKGVYGFLYEAWPIAYPDTRLPGTYASGESGNVFHSLKNVALFLADHPQYFDVMVACHELYQLHH